MAHMMKHTRASCGHMFKHYERAKDETGEYIKFGNQDIDTSKTHLNYNLAAVQLQGDFVKKRCSEVYCLNRKDVNVMCSWVITAPTDVLEQEQKKFFQTACDFMADRYGRNNVVSAYVHMDETTPHMHFAFVPVKYDSKKQRNKISAKEVVNRTDLRTFHEDLSKYMERSLGHEVSILNEATKEGNKSIDELKRFSATERLQEVQEKASKIVFKAQKQAQGIEDSLISIQAEYEAKKAYVESMSKDFGLIDGVKENKTLFGKVTSYTVPTEQWETQAVTRMDRMAQEKADKIFEQNVQKFKTTASADYIRQLSNRIERLEEELTRERMETRMLKEQLLRSEKEKSKVMDKVNKVLNRLPENTANEFIKEWKKPMQQNRGFER